MKRTLVVEEQSKPEDIQIVRQGLDEFNTAFGGPIVGGVLRADPGNPLSVVQVTVLGILVGAIIGFIASVFVGSVAGRIGGGTGTINGVWQAMRFQMGTGIRLPLRSTDSVTAITAASARSSGPRPATE